MRTLSISSMSSQKNPIEATPFMWLKYIWNRVHRLQFNFNTIVTGDTGSGKTKFAIACAYILNPKRFNANFYTNSVAEFMDIVENKSKKGDTVVFDETGANLSAREWQSVGNILAGQALQTYRNRNLAVFFCTPDPSFTDIQLRKLLNCFVLMKRYNIDHSYADIRKVWVDRKAGKVGWPQFDFSIDDRRYKISRIKVERKFINLVPKNIMKAINEKDNNFKDAVLRKAKDTALTVEKARLSISKTPIELAQEILNDKEKYLNKSGSLDWHLVKGFNDNLSRDVAQTAVKLARKLEK